MESRLRWSRARPCLRGPPWAAHLLATERGAAVASPKPKRFCSHLWFKAIMAAGPPGGHGNPRHVFQLPSITCGIADPSKGQRHLHTVTQTFCPHLWSHTSRAQARARRFANCISNKPTSGVAAGPRQGCLAPAKDVWPPPGKSKKRNFRTLNPKKVYSGWPGVG